MANKWDFSLLIKARKVLEPFWKGALLKGRTWGPKREGNPFAASNITFTDGEEGDELVSISALPDGTLVIHQFRRVPITGLGLRVERLLAEEGLVPSWPTETGRQA